MTAERPSGSPPELDSERQSVLPARIGARYEVIERLGHGGMAVVYRVRDRSHAGEYALKQLTVGGSSHARELRTLFEREYQVLAQLQHPSVVEVHDFGIDPAGPYYTMELLDGGDLSTRAPLTFQAACAAVAQVCSSLSLLHSRGFVHRDISPRNVRFTRTGVAKLIDFGAMVPVGPCVQAVGTPGFIAPEVIHHLGLDARTDVFSLGATLYYAVTGQRPFAARTLSELPDAWRQGPAALAQSGRELPAAFEALVTSMLQMDPVRRPSSAFEVRQRLAAIGGVPPAESAEISRAYLSTPRLVGRDAQLKQFRHFLRRTLQGDGLGLMLEGSSGAGRTRFWDTCLLDVETSGAVVLRVVGRAARPDPFATLHGLVEQLIEALPDEAVRCADEIGIAGRLFESTAGCVRLHPASAWSEDRYAVQAAVSSWLLRLSSLQPIAIAVDDVERIDDASLALLVALVDVAAGARLLILTTAASPLSPEAPPALAILKARSIRLAIAPLSAAEIEELFASVFAGAPFVSLVSDRIHKLAAGSPREALSLAMHMLDRGLIRYAGTWILPAALSIDELPASAEAALCTHLNELTELPRRLVEAQALALDGPWTHTDYCALAPLASGESVTDALSVLVRTGLIVASAGAYTLSHPGVRAGLCAQLTAAVRALHERALAQMCARTGRPALLEVMHLLAGESFDAGLDRLLQAVPPELTALQLCEQSGLGAKVVAGVLERAHEYAKASGRSLREQCELQRKLVELSSVTDSRIYYRHAPALLAQLERDSGLSDYSAAHTPADSAERLQIALLNALARYTATPESERVYRVDEAIRVLANHVTLSISIGARTMDTRLLASLPPLLEPLAGVSPVLHSLWQNALAATELAFKFQYDRARVRLTELYERLERMSLSDFAHRDRMLHSVAHGVAMIDVALGNSSAERWLSRMENDPHQRVTALYLRRAQRIFDGDAEGAERLRRQAEVLAVQANARQIFEPPLTLELYLQVQAGDLTAVKQVADRIAQLAAEWPGWRAQHHLAQGCFHRLRGDAQAAKAEFEIALAEASPERTDPPPMLRVWAMAAENYVAVLEGLGMLEQARSFGQRARDTCDALALSGLPGVTRALAVVEARLGHHARAAGRLDALIERHAQLRPSQRAWDFEARARVAILANDAAGAAQFTRLATQDVAAGGDVEQRSRRGRLMDEARRAGLELDVPESSFESALRATSVRPEHAKAHAAQALVAAVLGPLAGAGARAQRALELLCAAQNARGGHLYYATDAQLVRSAVIGTPDSALDRFASGYWRQRREQAAMTSVFTAPQLDAFELPTGLWTSPDGTRYVLVPLSPIAEAECVGLVALPGENAPLLPEYWALSAALSAHLLALGDVAAAS